MGLKKELNKNDKSNNSKVTIMKEHLRMSSGLLSVSSITIIQLKLAIENLTSQRESKNYTLRIKEILIKNVEKLSQNDSVLRNSLLVVESHLIKMDENPIYLKVQKLIQIVIQNQKDIQLKNEELKKAKLLSKENVACEETIERLKKEKKKMEKKMNEVESQKQFFDNRAKRECNHRIKELEDLVSIFKLDSKNNHNKIKHEVLEKHENSQKVKKLTEELRKSKDLLGKSRLAFEHFEKEKLKGENLSFSSSDSMETTVVFQDEKEESIIQDRRPNERLLKDLEDALNKNSCIERILNLQNHDILQLKSEIKTLKRKKKRKQKMPPLEISITR